MYIKSYEQDYAYKEHWYIKYQPEEAEKIIKKLVRHFKLNNFGEVYFKNYSCGYACSNGDIELPKKDIKLGMICHELGHLLAYKNGYRGHTKKAYKYIHRIYKYGVKYIPIEALLKAIQK